MLRLAFGFLALALLPGCGGGSGEDRLTVLAASSLHRVVPELAAAFERQHELELEVAYGSSSRLAAQVDDGAPGDVVLAADDVSLARLEVRPQPFATTHMVVALAPGNPGGVRSVADLGRVRTVMAAAEVPAGRYAAQVLARAGVAAKPVSYEPDARAVVTKVAQGEVDAALVYAIDAGGLTTVPLDPDHDVTVTYTLALVKRSAAAEAFADFVRAGDGQRVLHDAGFGPP